LGTPSKRIVLLHDVRLHDCRTAAIARQVSFAQITCHARLVYSNRNCAFWREYRYL